MVRRQRVQTYTFCILPCSISRRCCTLTLNRRLVCRLEWLTLFPYCGRRWHTSQRAPIRQLPLDVDGSQTPPALSGLVLACLCAWLGQPHASASTQRFS